MEINITQADGEKSNPTSALDMQSWTQSLVDMINELKQENRQQSQSNFQSVKANLEDIMNHVKLQELTFDDKSRELAISTLLEAGNWFYTQFQMTFMLLFLDLGLECLNRALGFSLERPKDTTAGLLNRMALFNLKRYLHSGGLSHVCTAVECYARAVSLGSMDFENMVQSLFQVLLILRHQYQMRGNLDVLDGAIECAYWIVSLTHEAHEDFPNRLIRLGHCCMDWSQRVHDREAINLAVESINRAVKLTPNTHAEISSRMTDLSSSHFRRFLLLLNSNDLNEAIEILAMATSITHEKHPGLPSRLASLSRYYEIRFTRLEKIDDLEEAVKYSSRVIDLAPNARGVSAHLPNLLSALGNQHRIRFRDLHHPSDIDKAIEYGVRAVTLAPENHKYFAHFLSKLGYSHKERFLWSSNLGDIDNAIGYQARAVATTHEHLVLLDRLGVLGDFYVTRFERLGEQNDIDQAIEYIKRAVDLSPPGHASLPSLLATLGDTYLARFTRFGMIDDINKSVETHVRAVELTPEGDSNIPTRLTALGNSHNSRFLRLGTLKDADQAIEYTTRAIDLAPDAHPDLAARLCDLGNSYANRFGRLGVLDDIHRAIEFNSRGVALTPEENEYLPARLNSLGNSYRSRYERMDDSRDIEKAIEYHSCAVALTPENHIYLGARIQSLGHSHIARGLKLHELADIEKALECFARDVELTPENHPSLPNSLSNLGNSHDHRYSLLGKREDIKKAIEFKIRAVSLTPNSHANLPGQLANLAESYMHYFITSQNQEFLTSAIDCFKRASECLAGHPKVALRSARRWGQVAARYSVSDPIKAYQTALDLVPRLVWLGSTVDQRYEDLHGIKGLVLEAATTAINSQNYDLAMEWLEQARSVVWSQTIQLRTPLDRLHSTHPELAERLQQLAHQLHGMGDNPNISDTLSDANKYSLEQVGQQQRRNAEEYEMLLSKIHQFPGFEDFLKPRKLLHLANAAKHGPVVTISCQQRQCDALVLLPGSSQIEHIALSGFSDEKAQTARFQIESALSKLGIRERGVRIWVSPEINDKEFETALATLWTGIAKPVLEFLGYMRDKSPGDLPHVTWCLTGALSFLPIHAAGDYDMPRAKVSDFVVSSYTPTLSALIASRKATTDPNSGILVVGQACTPGHSPLPGTSKELAYIKRHIHQPSCHTYTELLDDMATPEAVLKAMESHAWVHLACHAHQNAKDPSLSGFFLHGGTLSLAAIRRKHFTNNGLAFLSACQTATGDKSLPDEAVHLASGVLMAGYPSVIATMWSVMDDDAPFVADKVYGELVQGNELKIEKAANALHNATTALREMVGAKNFARWVPYIHIGS